MLGEPNVMLDLCDVYGLTGEDLAEIAVTYKSPSSTCKQLQFDPS